MISVPSETKQTKSSETDAVASFKPLLYWNNGIKREGKHNVPFQISTQVKFNILLSLAKGQLKFRQQIVSVIKVTKFGT